MLQRNGAGAGRLGMSFHDDSTGLFEALEARMLLYTPPLLSGLPDIGLLADPGNTVVRMHTNFGSIDIELFDAAGPDGSEGSAAPRTAANFINYVEDGDYDLSFFHRLVSGFVLQGGGFRFDDDEGLSRVPTDDPIENEFSTRRLNLERTIAMAKTFDPDSATSQFFFNLQDNPTLDNPANSGGFSVFGRVIQGWSVVLQIAGFEIESFTDTDPALGEVPVVPGTPSDPDLAENILVEVIDAEVIKPGGAAAFFTHVVYYPEGFRTRETIELVEVANLDTDNAGEYQVIVHYETGARDAVIASGTLEPGARTSILINDFQDPALSLVRGFKAYAFEVRSTTPVAATLEHFDFNASTSETFINPQPLSASDLRTWTFGTGRRDPDVFGFLVFQNLTPTNTALKIDFVTTAQGTISINRTLEGLRRGGLNLSLLPLPAGDFSMIITSDQPIVAAYSEYEPTGDSTTARGVFGGGSTVGVLPGAWVPTDGDAFLRLQLTDISASLTFVEFDFFFNDGTQRTSDPLLLSTSPLFRTREYDLTAEVLDLPRDEFFTIRYRIRSVSAQLPITVHYVSEVNGEEVSTPFYTGATDTAAFGGAFVDPNSTEQNEVLSLFNPFDDAGTTLTYRVGFLFADDEDGTADEIIFPGLGQGTLDPLERIDINIRDLSEVIAKIQADTRFRRFSIIVTTQLVDGGSTSPGLALAQLTRTDPFSGNSVSSIGMLGDGDFTLFSNESTTA